ncbi:TlpA family protein disulfide reductase [Halorubrum vacuolatum]|uniref:Thiol-disulfide isomerase or thioredoxin n=1 Tax=Halorubrum vacuolatum TaxID=63740 RepID=A0A238UWJ0_HALVU|nr:TlpA disulfide reductase family protein [Halorubrum vacuolatum]SNR26251.1 Thiol-disulfide isomerase or thioredoxin [Halorubrum vacuolatum]
MNRRTLLSTAAGAVGIALGGGAYAYHRRRDDGSTLAPVEVETLDAPGSEAGRREVPEPGSVTVVELFATWCSSCAAYMETLRAVEREVDATMVSVTNEPVGVSVDRETVVDWWDEHDGAWTVGLDEDLMLTTELDATSVPYTAVIDPNGRVAYASDGTMDAAELIAEIDAVVGE